MTRTINTSGGGARTNKNGLKFEQATDLADIFKKHPLFTINGDNIYDKKTNKHIATLYKKHKLYKNLLNPKQIDYHTIISKQMLPDEAILVHKTSTLYIIEKKFQKQAGSVDEKLATCDFKKKQYTKLLRPLNIEIKYCYVLCDWFTDPKYNDVKNYIESVDCKYFINSIPLDYLNLL